jgi:GntR family transcriptional regulator
VHSAEKFIPNYYRLESHLRESIRSGALKPGDSVPPESQLCQQFAVSRTTVRQALARLVFEGLIERHRGRGSFVAEPRLEHSKPLLSFEEEMRARGATTSIKLLDMRTEGAEGKVAERLGLTEGTPVVVLERLRFVNGQVVGYEIRYLPKSIGEALTPDEIHHQPLVPALRRILGKPRTCLSLHVTARTARRKEAGVLKAKPGAAVLVREHTWYYEPEGPMQYGRSVFRGDRYQMSVDFTATPNDQPEDGRSGRRFGGSAGSATHPAVIANNRKGVRA